MGSVKENEQSPSSKARERYRRMTTPSVLNETECIRRMSSLAETPDEETKRQLYAVGEDFCELESTDNNRSNHKRFAVI